MVALQVADVVLRFPHLSLQDIGTFDDAVVSVYFFLQLVKLVL